MLSIAASLIGSLELAIMECFWERGPQTSGDILTALRKHRTIAPSTVTTTLVRLCEQGLLTRELEKGGKLLWIYTARYASRGAFLAGTFEHLALLGADHLDRAEALGLLLGVVRVTQWRRQE
jgi:hypothetical protein